LQAGYGGPLPDWDPSSGPSSSHYTPAGQVDGEQGQSWSPTAQFDSESNRLDHSLPSHTLLQGSYTVTEATGIAVGQSATILECAQCYKTFPKRHLLNKHMKTHNPPFQCEDCGKAFQYKKDLRRHCGSQHPELVEEPTMLFCPYLGCKFSAERSTGSTRKDNLYRHIQTQHG